jgi:hypothetical protein
MCGGSYIDMAATLDDLLAILEDVCDDDLGEDVVIWRGKRVVAVRLAAALTLAINP